MTNTLRTLVALALVSALSPLASAQCSLSFVGTVTATYSSPPRQVVFAGVVANSGTAVKQVVLRVRYTDPTGVLAGAFTYGPANLGPTAGTAFSITQSVPMTAPLGTYTLGFELIDFTAGPPGVTCAFQPGSVTVVPPRVGVPADVATAWEVAPSTDFFWVAPPPNASTTTAAAAVASPNPFVGQTTLSYDLPASSDVRLAVYDMLGREVAVLLDGYFEAGSHTATFDGYGLPAGTYLMRLEAGGTVQTRQITLVR